MSAAAPKRVQFSRNGGPEVFELVDQQVPDAAAGQIRVRVLAAGLNPVDYKIAASPERTAQFGELPAGNGNDFAGRVDQVGEDVTDLAVGDLVFGGKRMFAQADYLVAAASEVLPIPDGLSIEQAACLDIAGRTATAMVRRLGVTERDTVLVSAASGGVGLLTAQLCRLRGAVVVGTASDANHGFLSDLGILPVRYGEGMVERIRAAAPEGVDIVFDQAGRETLEAAIELGIPADHVNTIADKPFGLEHGFSTFGRVEADTDDLRELALLIAAGRVVYPVAESYPLERVREAYERLAAGHVRGKLVLTTE
ncbi:NADPH:quinone reductase [Paramicrobacterium humi]|uniref:NADPH:quinone reductase n=1 Tax=Paramicrobacterium humi TaxID=640635 RepID=A0A1H4LDH9_9MICO|nr:NADP-dependent oxidoreductase [Microbacterium humi]SEB68760.1 NADPH:quinone reductase [Microbacterium humi]